jgi:ppGpp synthetase/RelA/SpoT-type nucleotidyltranferase
MNTSDWVKQYQDARPLHERFTTKLHSLIDELLEREAIKAVIESRAKEVESFEEKLNRPDKCYENPLKDMTDLSGIRVILPMLDDVEKVTAITAQEFTVDDARSVNKLDLLAPDRFGYLSQHYIVKIKEPRCSLAEWEDFVDLYAEVQVRTVLQHAWAGIEHSLNYKSTHDVPKQLRRRMFRLSALFELADQELNSIVAESLALFEQYKAQVESNEPDIELNLDSLRAYLRTSNVVQDWADFIESLGVTVHHSDFVSRDIDMLRRVGINSINELNRLLEDSKEWGQSYLKEFYRNTWGEPIPEGKCASDRNAIVTLLLIGNFPDVFTNKVLVGEFRFGRPERATVPARKHNPRFRDS